MLDMIETNKFTNEFLREFASFTDLSSSAKPDERAVITCVSSYYHTFSGVQKVLNYDMEICVTILKISY